MLTLRDVVNRAQDRWGPIPNDQKGYRTEVILDSVNPWNRVRATTFRVKYPYYIHQDELRHRATRRHELVMTDVDDEWSRSVASSRAISLDRMIQMIVEDPVEPPRWQYNQAGMQPAEDLSELDRARCQLYWETAKERCLEQALQMMQLSNGRSLHKQWISIILIPFMWVTELRTATDFANYYALRAHGAARWECQLVAKAQLKAHVASTPMERVHHLPFIKEEQWQGLDDGFISLEDLYRQSTAMCARTSYQTHEGRQPCLPDDLALFNKLMGGHPKHVSPAENVLTARKETQYWGNLCGWESYRHQLPENTIREFTYQGVTFR